MSTDTVDDLHAAEDFASGTVALLEQLLALTREVDTDGALTDVMTEDELNLYRRLRRDANVIVETWGTYCRPTCGAEGDPESEECTDITCGCPCQHAEERADLLEHEVDHPFTFADEATT